MAEYIKHTCKDCIHFKICNDYVYLIGRESKVACPDYKSAEDDVPSSEYERLQAQVNRLKAYDKERDIQLHQRLVREAKQEAYKEAFWEIKRFHIFRDDFHFYTWYHLNNILAELEKKYIGEKL